MQTRLRASVSLLVLLTATSCRGSGIAETTAPPTGGTTETTGPTAETPIDTLLRARWQAAGIVPAARADDATFLRRVHLDVVGTVPTSERTRSFLADPAPDKRARLVDELLDSPRYATHMADTWDQILMGPQVRAPVLDRGALRRWLEVQFTRNTPYDELVTHLVTAEGMNSAGGSRGIQSFVGGAERGRQEMDDGVNGATNWLLRYGRRPQDLAGNASRVFLGVQIQCAQCHDHKTEPWTTEHFRSFTAAFAHTRAVPLERRERGMIRQVELEDVTWAPRRWFRDDELTEIAEAAPRALDGTSLEADSRRRALATWMTGADNPWFARALVNRMWAHMLGTGFVEPVDDFRPSNPAIAPEVLDALVEDFVRHDYDLRHLLRTIAATEAYQRAPYGGASSGETPAGALWSRYPLKPMRAGVLLSSLVDATGVEPVLERVSRGDVEKLKLRMRRQLGFVFDDDVESNPEEFEGTISQALFLLNGLVTNAATSAVPDGELATLLASDAGRDAKVTELYLRALSRPPTPDELDHWIEFVRTAKELPDGEMRAGGSRPKGRLGTLARRRFRSTAATAEDRAYEDLFWALINSSEFHFNH